MDNCYCYSRRGAITTALRCFAADIRNHEDITPDIGAIFTSRNEVEFAKMWTCVQK